MGSGGKTVTKIEHKPYQMNHTIDVSKLIDHRNKDIYDQISSKLTVAFEPSFNGEHSVFTINNDVTFYIPVGVHSVDAFAHELLHTYMNYHGVFIAGNFKNTVWQSNILKQLLDIPLAEHVTNCIAHKLMLPLYLKRGFDRTLFLFDYFSFKAEPGVLKQIERDYRFGNQYSRPAVRNFIGKYFAVTCDPNPEFDYQNELKHLRKIDSQLFQILEGYLLQWSDYDFTNDELGSFRAKNDWLYQQLKSWLNGKRFY
jgi:hypothetical protein